VGGHLSQFDVIALVDQDIADSPRHVEPQLRLPSAFDGATAEDFANHVTTVYVMDSHRQRRELALVGNPTKQEYWDRYLGNKARTEELSSHG